MHKKKLFSLIMVAAMVLQVFSGVFPQGVATAGGGGGGEAKEIDKAILLNLTETITQGGAPIPVGGTLTSNKPIRVDISFGVPVEGDYPTPANPVQKGDTVVFELSSAFKLPSPATIDLKMGTLPVGEVVFAEDPDTKMVTATVTFNGDESVFDGGSHTVTCQFEADFTYDASGENGQVGDHPVTILEKTYTVNVPATPIVYSVTKQGEADLASQSITWTVTINAKQDSQHIGLAGYKFSDSLDSVGKYIADSFKVGGTVTTPNETDPALKYEFPDSSISPQTITFQTTIPDEKYYANSEQKVSNTAQLLNSESTLIKGGSGTAKFTPKWIEKTGKSSDVGSSGVYDPENRTITWTITANHYGASLNNVIITDTLPAGLKLASAKWEKWDKDTENWIDATTFTITDGDVASGKFTIGNIDSMILLTIVTKVPDEDYTAKITRYTNSANIKWGSLPGAGYGTGNINVGVGYNAISKSGVADTAEQKIRWTVTVDTKKQTIPDLKVYDLLVYGDSTSIAGVTGIPSGVTQQYNQKFADNFLGSGTVVVNVIPIMQGTKRVADLLEITGLSTTDPNTFSFDSQVVNPDIFAGNKTSTVKNTATLFSANAKLNAATGNVNYKNDMLLKQMLKREAMSDPAAGVNNYTSDATKGFNYQDKSVIFRLNVNADGIDLTNTTNAANQALGIATLTDTLPEGWEFVDIVVGSKYLIFEGTSSGSTVSATDTTPDEVTDLTAVLNGREATFTFTTLDKPYVILVKAKLTDATAKNYFKANQTITKTNNVTLKTENWTTGVSSKQDVKIISQILSKNTIQPAAGELQWTVDYKPYDLDQSGTKLKDELPLGLDLRMDANGVLILDGNIEVNELTLNTDGTYPIGGPVTLVLGGNVHYDNATRTLSFDIPDSAKAYRFTYVTDITGEPGTVANKVSLFGSSGDPIKTGKEYIITSADGSASLKRNGWIVVTKTDGAGVALAGAEFTLFALDGTTVIKRGLTDSNGILRLKVIPDGEYLLRETAVPTGYVLADVAYSLKVTTSGSTVTSSIDGRTGSDANKIVVKNYKEGTVGSLTIKKMVVGDGADLSKLFTFTLTLGEPNPTAVDTYTYIGHGIAGGTIQSGDTISLAHGQSITVVGLPKDTPYKVTEADYSDDGYTMTSINEEGNIKADETQTASFTNTRTVGQLTISKTVAGSAGDISKEFNFTLMLEGNGAAGTYTYTGNGIPDGTIKSGDSFALAHGQSITVEELPDGAIYTVIEDDYRSERYTTTSVGSQGSIVTNDVQTAAFRNTKYRLPVDPEMGSLELMKTGADGNALAGAEFTLYNNLGEVLQTALSGADGLVRFNNVLIGHYTIRETKAPTGYEASTEVLTATVMHDGVVVRTTPYTVVNEKIDSGDGEGSGTIELMKTDAEGNPLLRAEFTLYDEDGEVVQVAYSDIDGLVRFEEVPLGSYTIKETVAPEGYDASDIIITAEIVVEDELVQATPYTLVNTKTDDPKDPEDPDKPTDPEDPAEPGKPGEPTDPAEPGKPGEPTDPTEPGKPGELPKAGGLLDTTVLAIGGILLILAGLGYAFRKRYKARNNIA